MSYIHSGLKVVYKDDVHGQTHDLTHPGGIPEYLGKLIEQGKKFPFIVVSPQAPPNTGWKAELLKGMLDDLKRKYRVDNDLVYLTGLSMGGFGTWDLSQRAGETVFSFVNGTLTVDTVLLAIPIKAVVMTLLSLTASFGALVWIFQDGHLRWLLGFETQSGIEVTVPVVLLAVVFGLSMDYEVFLLSRIQEEWRRTGDNRESVLQGISHTGRIITSAALILIVVIGAFAAGDLVYVKQVGVGIAAAVALDVTLVRALLVPATMQLMGEWNWWAPRWMRRAA
jgi:hypothetical protein